ncbi:hypothetical protein TREES_T100003314 [Tupaia chinensis]|uniref:Cation channel sperm-associated protein subunit epsilon n=1 Tax=Tupaia chinensis TaxID=246437 RepID=L9JG10_TUPCH|nr:hypothetical protein TREES_T100003314 [Tupaia chinensis]
MSIFMSASGEIILVYLLDNGKLQAQSYPLKLEIQSITFKSQDKCPYAAFSNNVFNTFYILDKGENLTLWAEIVYPENFGLFVMVDAYGPKILEQKREIAYEIASGYCTKTMTITFYQSINYEAVNDYFKLQFNANGFIEDVKANFIVWEIHGRDDYSFNNTMKQNYRHCFSYAIGKPGDLNQPYEIINSSNGNHIYWPMGHSGMYVFRVKILDPNYSYCNLTAIFAVETTGVIPRPNAYLVASLLFVLMLLFLSILVLSYFHYMTIYRQNIYEPLHKLQSKQKKN